MNDNGKTNRIVEILLIEDDPNDVELAREALDDIEVGHHLTVVENGVEALAYLRAEGDFQYAIQPDLILLDLKMPKKNGLEVLAEIKADQNLRRIPVIVLTTSDAPDDILEAYDLQASCYVTKPADLEEFVRVMGLIRDFCLTIVRLPPRVSRTEAISSRR
jgi:two-component system response regulator